MDTIRNLQMIVLILSIISLGIGLIKKIVWVIKMGAIALLIYIGWLYVPIIKNTINAIITAFTNLLT